MMVGQEAAPIFIEIAGLPGSGKSTAVSEISRLLSSKRISHRRFEEAASNSPFLDLDRRFKRDWRFAAWSVCRTLAAMIEGQASKKERMILVDRGLVDMLCWVRWHERNGRIPEPTARAIEAFVQIPQWFDRIELLVILRVSFATTLRVRGLDRGQIRNEPTFLQLRQVYDDVVKDLRRRPIHPRILVIDTDHLSQYDVRDRVMDEITSMLRLRKG